MGDERVIISLRSFGMTINQHSLIVKADVVADNIIWSVINIIT